MAKIKASTSEVQQAQFDAVEETPFEGPLMPDEAEIEATVQEMLQQMDDKFVNLLIVGATGSGKSSTVNSLFNMSVAKVGTTANPETKDISSYVLGNLTLWDTPGLGDNEDADAEYARQIALKLDEINDDGALLIDIVLVVLDASSKDMGTSIRLISETILPHLHSEQGQKILVAVNQADMAMKGNHWDYIANKPDETLKEYLEEKTESVRRRILESTGVEVEPIYYCAGYTDDDGTQRKAYNLAKLLYRILKAVDSEKVFAFAGNINEDEEMFESNDDEENYGKRIAETFGDIFSQCVDDGVEKGGLAGGMIAGVPGLLVGMVIGGLFGGVVGLFKGIINEVSR